MTKYFVVRDATDPGDEFDNLEDAQRHVASVQHTFPDAIIVSPAFRHTYEPWDLDAEFGCTT